MLLWAGLGGPGSGEIICETKPVLIQTSMRARIATNHLKRRGD